MPKNIQNLWRHRGEKSRKPKTVQMLL